MNNSGNINDFVPSILNPRCVKKQEKEFSLSQHSVVSRHSLSLRRNTPVLKKNIQNNSLDKENCCNIRFNKNLHKNKKENSQEKCPSIYNAFNGNECYLSKRTELKKKKCDNNDILNYKIKNKGSSRFSAVNVKTHSKKSGSLDFDDLELPKNIFVDDISNIATFNYLKLNTKKSIPLCTDFLNLPEKDVNIYDKDNNRSIKSVSSATSIKDEYSFDSDDRLIYNITEETPVLSVSFGVVNCETINITCHKNNMKKISINRNNNDLNVDCEIIESSQLSTESICQEDTPPFPTCQEALKRPSVNINVDIKRRKLSVTDNAEENISFQKVLILKTDAIKKLSHVIVQPSNHKSLKRRFSQSSKLKNSTKRISNEKTVGGYLKQTHIDCYFKKHTKLKETSLCDDPDVSLTEDSNVELDMSRNLTVINTIKSADAKALKINRKQDISPRSLKVHSARKDFENNGRQNIKASSSEVPRVLSYKKDSVSSHSPRKNVESIQFALPSKSKTIKGSSSAKNIPPYKIVAGTHFAVDAFCYGEIPNVKHYFLTHFHSDHYCGLKKSFNKLLFCSKITAALCISRLGVNPKCVHIIDVDEVVKVDGVEVTAVDANHCPGAIMLVFSLPNGKTILHTGDFRATPDMESYSIFWNKDIHTIYLDTTYCNPRYDFPTQDQSIEMALYLLRQKKNALEKVGKKFSSVLIVCGTYTIGKEKFFLGMARRVGCSVWACPEKDKVLQIVEGRSFGNAPPQSCQLHVVPMRDLTYEKLRCYLDSLQGAFSEVVAFKPSGWENGKNSTIEEEMVTIHGIPYSEHSSFSEMIRFVKYLKPRHVVPTVDISGGTKAVQKYFPCPLMYKDDVQKRLSEYFSIQSRPVVPAVT